MLKRLFIKDYKNTSDPNVRNAYGKVAGVFGIFTNLILGVIKFVIGIISNSVSIMADAINNIADTASSILTIIGFKLASKKPDKKHPYGFHSSSQRGQDILRSKDTLSYPQSFPHSHLFCLLIYYKYLSSGE